VLVWGEGFDPARLPPKARTIYLAGWQAPEHARADVVIPIAIQTERAGTFTNFEGQARAFEACFTPIPGARPAEGVFAALVRKEAIRA
jgi:NADH dehydrogenase/NADH:ubiquinone oxidoreductase subunit G